MMSRQDQPENRLSGKFVERFLDRESPLNCEEGSRGTQCAEFHEP